MDLGDRVGQSGIELQYDRFLRGKNGASRVQVDALGNLNRRLHEEGAGAGPPAAPVGGPRRAGGGPAGARGRHGPGRLRGDGHQERRGARPRLRAVLRPEHLLEGDQAADLDRSTTWTTARRCTTARSRAAIPPAPRSSSITATAALESGLITPDTPLTTRARSRSAAATFENAGGVAHGALALRQALTVSSDVFFYQLGAQLDSAGDGLGLQRWARRLGIGRDTGIDLPGELPGLLPTPEVAQRALQGGDTDRPWSPGDNVNLAVGQGDLQADPMQMAVAYAAIANGGVCCGRGSGQRIEDSSGAPSRARGAAAAAAQHQAPSTGRPSSTACAAPRASRAAPRPRCSRTSRSRSPARRAPREHVGQPDQSWYVALAPWPSPRYVVAVTDEAGGFGADTAAPMARRILGDALPREGKAEPVDRGVTGLMRARVAALDGRYASPVHRQGLPRAARAVPRPARIDPLLCSRRARPHGRKPLRRRHATQDDIAGDPNYYLVRQAGYVGVGILLMLRDLPLRLLAAARMEAGIYGIMIGSILLVYGLGVLGARIQARDRAPLHQLPGVRARQAVARALAVGLHGRPHAATRRSRDHQPDHAARG